MLLYFALDLWLGLRFARQLVSKLVLSCYHVWPDLPGTHAGFCGSLGCSVLVALYFCLGGRSVVCHRDIVLARQRRPDRDRCSHFSERIAGLLIVHVFLHLAKAYVQAVLLRPGVLQRFFGPQYWWLSLLNFSFKLT